MQDSYTASGNRSGAAKGHRPRKSLFDDRLAVSFQSESPVLERLDLVFLAGQVGGGLHGRLGIFGVGVYKVKSVSRKRNDLLVGAVDMDRRQDPGRDSFP